MEVLQRTANRGSISTGYEIDNSVKIEPANYEGLHFTPSSTTNTDTFTFSCWFKRTEISNQINTLFGSYTDGSNHALFRFKTDNTLELRFVTTGTGKILVSDMLFRDTSAWYHMVLAVDTTDGTTANRVKVYINGEQITLTGSYPNQNQDCVGINTASKAMNVGYLSNFSNVEFAGYMAEAHHIDGSQLAPTAFGEVDEDSGIWKPKAYTGSYGTNGFYLDFSDSANLGDDASGNGNNFTETNITSADQATDTPTNNFCTLNPVMLTQANTVISQGATSLFSTGASGNTVVGTMGVSRGKWYWEFKHINAGGTAYWSAIGYTSSESTDSTQTAGGGSGYPSYVALLPNGGTFVNGSIISGKFNTFSVNDIAGVALDMDNGDMYLYKNGTIQNSGNPIFTSIGDFAMPVGSVYLNGCGGYFNFGGFTSYTPSSAASDENGYGTFEYAPPSGYYALCGKNLAEYGGTA